MKKQPDLNLRGTSIPPEIQDFLAQVPSKTKATIEGLRLLKKQLERKGKGK